MQGTTGPLASQKGLHEAKMWHFWRLQALDSNLVSVFCMPATCERHHEGA